jgi:hypothetical protein
MPSAAFADLTLTIRVTATIALRGVSGGFAVVFHLDTLHPPLINDGVVSPPGASMLTAKPTSEKMSPYLVPKWIALAS